MTVKDPPELPPFDPTDEVARARRNLVDSLGFPGTVKAIEDLIDAKLNVLAKKLREEIGVLSLTDSRYT